MTNIFDDVKYQKAARKAKDFIKRQLNVNNYTLFPTLKEAYDSAYTGRIFANVDMPTNASINYPSYIYCDKFYDETYKGVVSGKHQNTGAARMNLAVEVTIHTDQKYRSVICFLHADGTWRSEVYYRETDYYGVGNTVTKSETYWYKADVIINENGSNGIKGFNLKYYNWIDDLGNEIYPDNLPKKITQVINPVPIDPTTGKPQKESFLYAKTYQLKPFLMDDTIIDDAIPIYADYIAHLNVFSDVEYLTAETPILFDGVVKSSDLPANPPVLPVEPVPFISDSIVQPSAVKGTLIFTWITNFADACTFSLDGVSQSVKGTTIALGYYTYHVTATVSLNADHTYTIRGKGTSLSKSFRYNDSNRYMICGDPQIIKQNSADTWYKVQKILNPLPALIISMGDQVDSITDAIVRKEQYHMFAKEHSVPIATVRGNHDRNEHYFGHFGLPSNAQGADFYFQNGNVLFIAIDTNDKDVIKHKNFIKNALSSSTYRWAVLLMHHSMYSTSKRANSAYIKTLRDGLSNFIINETNICMVIAGHEHFLCRTSKPGKLFFTAATSTGSKFEVDDYLDAPWNEVTINTPVPKYTVMDVTDQEITLNTFDLYGTLVDRCVVK